MTDQPAFFRSPAKPDEGAIEARFVVRARFDPRCKCEDFEYRQYIAGNVELHDQTTGGVLSLNNLFAVPGGLTNTLKEDGDTGIPSSTAGHRFGHRSASAHPTDNRDRYLPSRATGCEYSGVDVPNLVPVPATPGDAGDRYEWLLRFRGVITRRGQGVVEEKYWALRGPVVIR